MDIVHKAMGIFLVAFKEKKCYGQMCNAFESYENKQIT